MSDNIIYGRPLIENARTNGFCFVEIAPGSHDRGTARGRREKSYELGSRTHSLKSVDTELGLIQ